MAKLSDIQSIIDDYKIFVVAREDAKDILKDKSNKYFSYILGTLLKPFDNCRVYDPCCGTGGFLVAAMQRLFNLAGNDKRKREEIRKRQMCGVELRPDIFTYACSSMRFRGDGKSNIYNGSCFTYESIIKDNHKPTVAFLNPPYDVGNARQMEFIEHASIIPLIN